MKNVIPPTDCYRKSQWNKFLIKKYNVKTLMAKWKILYHQQFAIENRSEINF